MDIRAADSWLLERKRTSLLAGLLFLVAIGESIFAEAALGERSVAYLSIREPIVALVLLAVSYFASKLLLSFGAVAKPAKRPAIFRSLFWLFVGLCLLSLITHPFLPAPEPSELSANVAGIAEVGMILASASLFKWSVNAA